MVGQQPSLIQFCLVSGTVLDIFLVLIKYRGIICHFPPFQMVHVFDLTF